MSDLFTQEVGVGVSQPETAISTYTFTRKELVKAVELMISKNDIRNQPGLCMAMLQSFGFTAKDIAETLRSGKYVDFNRRSALGLVAVK